MGYYTSYELKVKDFKVTSNKGVLSEFMESSEEARHALNANGETEQECKWYDHDKELLEFSKQHPNKLFVLSGEGEESGDIWTKYFVNGKVQAEKAEVKVLEFDKDKLK